MRCRACPPVGIGWTWCCPDSNPSAATVFVSRPAKTSASISRSSWGTSGKTSPSRPTRPRCAHETASLGTVVDHEQVVELPLNGRASSRCRRWRPASRCRRARSCPRINGGRPRTNEYLFDGISVLQPEPGQVAFFPIIDAIQEFKIESNSPPAEFGRFNGGVINLTTRAGSERRFTAAGSSSSATRR